MHIQTFEDPASSAEYDSISGDACYPRPVCWIDVDNLHDPEKNTSYDPGVSISAHFLLSDFVQSELSYSHKVLLSPSLVEHLERYAEVTGSPVRITSGFRSPRHQRAVCQGICGMDCCTGGPNPCACRSRHEWGDAADIASTDPPTLYGSASQAGFPYCLAETGHIHVDLRTCGGGCP